MAFTRKFLSALGIEAEKIDEIMTAHVEVTDALKAEVTKNKDAVTQLEAVTKERDELKANAEKQNGEESVSKKKYDKLSDEFEEYKKTVEAEKTESAKDKAIRAYFKAQGFTDNDVDIAVRGCSKEKESLEIEDGKIKDTSSLDELVKGIYSRFKTSEQVKGVNTATPPASGTTKKTKEQIAAIKDPEERRAAISENIELFQ